MYTPEASARINDLRQKILAGTITMDELKEGIRIMMEGRKASLSKPKPSKSSSKQPVNVDALFDELDQMK